MAVDAVDVGDCVHAGHQHAASRRPGLDVYSGDNMKNMDYIQRKINELTLPHRAKRRRFVRGMTAGEEKSVYRTTVTTMCNVAK